MILRVIETEQELIKVESGEGVILPKKDLSRIGAKPGDILRVRVELVSKSHLNDKLARDYESFLSKYGEDLKNLADK